MQIKSILRPEGSVLSGVAVAGSVIAIYSLDCGNVSNAHFTEANHPSLESSRKKAAITAFIFVSAITLLSRDANTGILGYGTMIAADIHYRTAIMADPSTGRMQPEGEAAYAEAQNVVPMYDQGQNAG